MAKGDDCPGSACLPGGYPGVGMRSVILLSLAVLLAGGCSRSLFVPAGSATAVFTPPSISTSPIVRVVPTETPAAEDVAFMSTSTATAVPSGTPTLTPPPSPTRTHTHTPSPSHTATPRPTSTVTSTPSPYPVPSGNITRIDTTFHSASLQLDRELIIYLPPGYNVQSARRYPVLYFLHGWGGFDLKHTTEWESWGFPEKVQELIDKGEIQPMIVVQPNGFTVDGQCSLFFNHGPGTDGKPWGDYIWKDVVNYIDGNYRTIPQRESRAIAGFSFGGEGAFSLALTHPEVFKVVAGHSPSFRGADGSISFINDWNWFNQFDPIWLVQNTDRAKQLSIWMDVATGDDKVRNCGADSNRCVEAFHALLASKGIPHAWQDSWPGPHEGSYWQAHFGDYLNWYSSQLLGQR